MSEQQSSTGSSVGERLKEVASQDREVVDLIFAVAWKDDLTGEIRLTVGAAGDASLDARKYMASELQEAIR